MSKQRNQLLPFLIIVCLFEVGWLMFVGISGDWARVAARWPIALSMALGSFVAGSTPMGGGTVGFPILVLAFGDPASMGRDFSLAIQSVGMTSASLFILLRRQPLARGILWPAVLGTLLGTPFGLWFVAPRVPELVSKVVFAVLWASFGVLVLVRLKRLTGHRGSVCATSAAPRLGFLLGLLGGALIASLTGVGIDMLLYVLLVLLFETDPRVAIPSSVILMATTSLVGVAAQGWRGALAPGLFDYWLAAAPVVAVGAPLGAFVTDKLDRRHVLLFVSLLCFLQFFWTLHHERAFLSAASLIFCFVAVAFCYGGFVLLERAGRRLRAASSPPPAIELEANLVLPES